MKILEPRKAERNAASVLVDEYVASGNARKYKADEPAHRAVAVLLLLATLDVVPGLTGKVAKATYAATPGAIAIRTDWTIPGADPRTRPDQGFERRLAQALAVAAPALPKAIGWGWYNHPDHGFVMFRTA